jgi:hypothetical protein
LLKLNKYLIVYLTNHYFYTKLQNTQINNPNQIKGGQYKMAKKTSVKIVQLDEAENTTMEDIQDLWKNFKLIVMAIGRRGENNFLWLVYLRPLLKPKDFKYIFNPLRLTALSSSDHAVFQIECTLSELKKQLIECRLKIDELSAPVIQKNPSKSPGANINNKAILRLKIKICLEFTQSDSPLIDIIRSYLLQLSDNGYDMSALTNGDAEAESKAMIAWSSRVNNWLEELLASGDIVEAEDILEGTCYYTTDNELAEIWERKRLSMKNVFIPTEI